MSELLDCGHPHDAGHPATVQQADGTLKTIQGWTFVYSLDGKRKICHACSMLETLDCGHTRSPHSHMSTGYGTDSDGKTLCYACCAERDKADMIATGRAVLYLSGDGWNPPPDNVRRMRVTNWPGSLTFPVINFSRKARSGGFGSQRTDAWFTGPDGFVWHAVNRGDNDIARCKRTKEKSK